MITVVIVNEGGQFVLFGLMMVSGGGGIIGLWVPAMKDIEDMMHSLLVEIEGFHNHGINGLIVPALHCFDVTINYIAQNR